MHPICRCCLLIERITVVVAIYFKHVLRDYMAVAKRSTIEKFTGRDIYIISSNAWTGLNEKC